MELKWLLERFSWKKASALLNKESRFLGVDIGSTSIKLAQLKKDKERAVLETYGELALAKYGEGAVGRAVRLIDVKLAEALKDLLTEAQVKTKDAIVSIPLKDSFLTTMDMPEMGEDRKSVV